MVTETETIEFLPKPPDIDVILRKIRSEVAQQKNESKLFLREQFATTKPGNSGLNPLILLPREVSQTHKTLFHDEINILFMPSNSNTNSKRVKT